MLTAMLLYPVIAMQFSSGPQGEVFASRGSSNPPTLGKESAAVEMTEFADFECPFCKLFALNTFPKIKKNYIDTGKILYIHRDFPLTTIHPRAEMAAEAAACANDQKIYWQMAKMLYINQKKWVSALRPMTHFRHYINVAGGDVKRFNQCVAQEITPDAIEADVAFGTQSDITGTPGFLIGGKVISGAMPYEIFAAALDAELAGKKWEISTDANGAPFVKVY